MMSGRSFAEGEWIVVRANAPLESAVLLRIGKLEVQERKTHLLSLDIERLISVDGRYLVRLQIVVEKQGRLYSGWVTEECLVNFEFDTRRAVSILPEEDGEEWGIDDFQAEGVWGEAASAPLFSKNWRELTALPRLEREFVKAVGMEQLGTYVDLKLECSALSGWPVASLGGKRPFLLEKPSTTRRAARFLFNMQGIANSLFFRSSGYDRLPLSVNLIGGQRREAIVAQDIFIGLGGSKDLVWLHLGEDVAAGEVAAEAMRRGGVMRIHCVRIEEVVGHQQDCGGIKENATVISLTVFRPIGLAGVKERFFTLLRFSFGLSGASAFVRVDDVQSSSLQEALRVAGRHAPIESINVEGYEEPICSNVQLNIVLAKLCKEYNSSLQGAYCGGLPSMLS